LSGLRLVFKNLRQMANLGKQNSRLTEHKRFPHTFLKLMLLRGPALNGFGQQEVFCNLRSVLKVWNHPIPSLTLKTSFMLGMLKEVL